MLNLVLFGPPGSGKGTQSEKIVEKYGLIHLSTGDLLRKEMREGTPLGNEAKSLIEKGQLVPDEVVVGMISSSLDKNRHAKGFLFDGFPRTNAQAESLDNLLKLHKTGIHRVLFLKVNETELINRLVGRAQTSGRLDDADPEIQRKRQDVYRAETLPVAAYYDQFGVVSEISGEGSIEEVFGRLAEKIETTREDLEQNK